VQANNTGTEMRTRDAIEQTSIVVIATLVQPGVVSAGPPGAHHIDDAGFRVERALTPPAGAASPVAANVKVSYTRQVYPEAIAEPPLERGRRYVLFCNIHSRLRLHALRIVPHSEETVRVVARAFDAGARHSGGDPGDRVA
jgi:hypothetical protein